MKKIISILIIIFSICIISKINAYTEYKVGDEVKYNNVDYYVIKDSSSNETSVTMLKAEPLTVEEVNNYGGVGTVNNHVNMYVLSDYSFYKRAYNNNGYGGMQYYSSSTCTDSGDISGCTNVYAVSEIKYVVDAWKNAEAQGATEARLITYDELTDNLGYEKKDAGTLHPSSNGTTPSWVYNRNYSYWTMSPYDDSTSNLWAINDSGDIIGGAYYANYYFNAVRPVIKLPKTELGDEDESVIEDNEIDDKENKINKEENKNNEKSVSSKVKVANTYMSKSLTIIIVGLIASVLSMLIFYKYVNKKV